MAQTFMAGGHAHFLRPRPGSGQEGPKLALYSEETTQTSAVGLAMDRDDGAVFRYGSNGTVALAAGKIVAQDQSVNVFASIDAPFVDAAGSAKNDFGTDDDEIYLLNTPTFQSENDYANIWAGGQLMITDDQGEGHAYRIKSHLRPEVAPVATAGLIKFVLHDKLRAALDSESSCAVIGHPYRNLVIANNGTDDLIQGASINAVSASTANSTTYYSWFQTWGWACVLADGAATIAAGTVAALSDDDNGGVQPIGGASFDSQDDIGLELATEPIVGYFGTAITDGEHGPVFLQIQP